MRDAASRRPETARVTRLRSLVRPVITGLAIMLTAGACKPLDDAMVMVFGRSMRDQRSFDPYEHPQGAPEGSYAFASGNYPAADGDVNLGQPEGIDVPRFTQMDLATPGVGNEVIQGLVNPVDPTDAEAMARGQELYQRYCVVCHGPDGVGANANIAAQHPILPAYNLSGPQVSGYSDQYLYAMIRVGRGLMPEYGSRITHFDRWKVVNYVRTLQAQAGSLSQGAN